MPTRCSQRPDIFDTTWTSILPRLPPPYCRSTDSGPSRGHPTNRSHPHCPRSHSPKQAASHRKAHGVYSTRRAPPAQRVNANQDPPHGSSYASLRGHHHTAEKPRRGNRKMVVPRPDQPIRVTLRSQITILITSPRRPSRNRHSPAGHGAFSHRARGQAGQLRNGATSPTGPGCPSLGEP